MTVDPGAISGILDLGMLGLLVIAVMALSLEWVVPGARHRKTEQALEKLQEKQATLIDSQGRLIETLEAQRKERTP